MDTGESDIRDLQTWNRLAQWCTSITPSLVVFSPNQKIKYKYLHDSKVLSRQYLVV